MKVEQARKGWDLAVWGLSEALTILRDFCGVLLPGLLPYNTIVIPMAAVCATQKADKGASVGANQLKIMRWFWCSVFGQKYENAPNSQAEKDYAELLKWMVGGNPPESVTGFRFDLDLRQVTPRQRAVYRGTMALLLQHGALDFHKRGKITTQLLGDKKDPVDDHHIFPRAFLDECKVPAGLRDCILNRTFIDSDTNKHLSKRSPSDYFSEIRMKWGEKGSDALFESHLLPDGDDSPLLKDDFEAFLAWRKQALQERIAYLTEG